MWSIKFVGRAQQEITANRLHVYGKMRRVVNSVEQQPRIVFVGEFPGKFEVEVDTLYFSAI